MASLVLCTLIHGTDPMPVLDVLGKKPRMKLTRPVPGQVMGSRDKREEGAELSR
jgi:hypothetical protein